MLPPENLDPDIKEIWVEVVDRLPERKTVDAVRLEVYCEQLRAFRAAATDVRKNGVTIEDATGRTIRNPSIDTLTAMTKQLNAWGGEFAPPSSMPKRRRGTMYDATRASVAAAKHLQGKKEFAGAIEAVCTLAWLIDEAQRAGLHALQSAAFGAIPSYMKGCAALQITPADAPEVSTEKPTKKRSTRSSSMRIVKVGA